MNVLPLEPGVPNCVRFEYNGFHQTGDIIGKYDEYTYKVQRYAPAIRRHVIYKVTFQPHDGRWTGQRVGTEPADI